MGLAISASPDHNRTRPPAIIPVVDACATPVNFEAMKAAGSKGVARFSISLPAELAAQLERMTQEKGYDKHGKLTVTSTGQDLPT